MILASSALKQSYRDQLHVGPEVHIIYLRGTPELLHKRMHERQGHFMTESMLASQLATLQEPKYKDALIIDISGSPSEIVSKIRERLGL